MTTKIVIGSSTTVSLDGASTYCALSANWGFEPGKQDAFCLGSFAPSKKHMVFKPQQTLSLTIYAPGPQKDVSPSETCDMADAMEASVTARTCDDSDIIISGDWLITSYNYSKETLDVPAQESWSLIKYIGAKAFLEGEAAARAVEPTTVLRGITQGQCTDQTVTGIGFQDSIGYATSETGSVSAGGIGKSTATQHGVVVTVGGGSSEPTDQGTGSASIPLNPMYVNF